MSQTFSWAGFSTGLTIFVGLSGELITTHTTWHELVTPIGIVHLIVLVGAFIAMVGSALNIQLPNNNRVSDKKLNDLNKEDDK